MLAPLPLPATSSRGFERSLHWTIAARPHHSTHRWRAQSACDGASGFQPSAMERQLQQGRCVWGAQPLAHKGQGPSQALLYSGDGAQGQVGGVAALADRGLRHARMGRGIVALADEGALQQTARVLSTLSMCSSASCTMCLLVPSSSCLCVLALVIALRWVWAAVGLCC